MNFIEFIFALLELFVPMETHRRETLKKDALAWYQAITPEASPALVVKLKEQSDAWYVQVGFASLFIFAVRWIKDFLNPTDDEDDDEEED